MKLSELTTTCDYKAIIEDELPPEIVYPSSYTPPAQVQQMTQQELDQMSTKKAAYTMKDAPKDQGASRDILNYIDSSYIEDMNGQLGYFKHVETPAGIITYVNGGVTSYMLDMFMNDFYEPVDIKLLVLNSRGGEVQDIKDIADGIRTRSIPVAVPDGAVCMSACNMMFAAGVGRFVGPNANFMIHHVRFGGDQEDGTRISKDLSFKFFNSIARLIGDPQYYQKYMKHLTAKLQGEKINWQNDSIYVNGSWIIEQGWANRLPK